jgi:UDP-sulfoquinovose synthase
MRVLILGGDGFCGWPTALYLSRIGHEVTIIDNLSRRNIDNELEVSSLTPIRSMSERIRVWEEVTGKQISFWRFDVATQYDRLLAALLKFNPSAVVHFAEQRAAPYSMKSSSHRRYTITNNLNATNNLLAAIVESELDVHVVHLGSMGVYGYGVVGLRIPEGYLPIKVEGPSGEVIRQEILFPSDPGSIYHLTKSQDQLLFAFYSKNDKVRVTDLHQGIVWGTQTEESSLDERLINRFDYDGDFGTVLNRFLVQAALGHPLSVYGSGRQTRAFINIRDTVRCIALAIANPPQQGERVRIYNQMTETFRVIDLANMISAMTGTSVSYVENLRKEAEENELLVDDQLLIRLGLRPVKLEAGLVHEILEIASKYASNCDKSKIASSSRW